MVSRWRERGERSKREPFLWVRLGRQGEGGQALGVGAVSHLTPGFRVIGQADNGPQWVSPKGGGSGGGTLRWIKGKLLGGSLGYAGRGQSLQALSKAPDVKTSESKDTLNTGRPTSSD